MKICKANNCNEQTTHWAAKYCPKHYAGSSEHNPKMRLWRNAENRCRDKGREFTLTWGGFIDAWPKNNRCPVFGFELVFGDDGPMGRNNSPSIDRIDSSKGYTDDNIQIISKLANSMKQNATEEQLLQFARYYADKLGNK